MGNDSKRGRVLRPIQNEVVNENLNGSGRCCDGRVNLGLNNLELGLGTGGCNTYGSM